MPGSLFSNRDITHATGVGGDTAEDFAYDALGRLTEAKDDDSTVQLTYDSLSRVLTEKQGASPLGSEAMTVTSTWDSVPYRSTPYRSRNEVASQPLHLVPGNPRSTGK